MNSRCTFLLSTIFLIIIVLAVTQIVVTNRLSTSGLILEGLREETTSYKQENEVLKTEIASASSITKIAKLAKQSGFVKDPSPLVLTQGQSFALR